MIFTQLVLRAGFLAAAVSCAVTTAAIAQPSKTSGGIKITISKVHVSGQKIIIQFNAANDTAARVYIREALFDPAQKAQLSSGSPANPPSAIGIPECNDSVDRCANPDRGGIEVNDLNRYTYIESNDSLLFSLVYTTPVPVADEDTISFSVTLIAKYASDNGNPRKAGAPEPVEVHYSNIPLPTH